jgi:hypothetical protein
MNLKQTMENQVPRWFHGTFQLRNDRPQGNIRDAEHRAPYLAKRIRLPDGRGW